MPKATWLGTLVVSGLAAGAAKLIESHTGAEVPLAAASAMVVAEVVRDFLIHLAHSQREAHLHAAEGDEPASRNHHLRRGMAAALRRGLKQARLEMRGLPGDPYNALFKSWDYVLGLAEAGDPQALERFFPEQFAEPQWEAANAYSANLEEDASALAGLLRELLEADAIYKEWSEDQALEFARQALPYYRQAFADDLAGDSHGQLFQAFTVKGINQIRSLVEQSIRENRAEHERMRALIIEALANRREAPVKEPLIGLPNYSPSRQILARDREAQELLNALRPDGPGIVSIAAPPGFGKSAVFARSLQMALPKGGIAVLDAKDNVPGIASFANLLGRMTGLQETAARFQSAVGGRPSAKLRELFFDFLHQAGKVWLVVENAERVLAPAAAAESGRRFPGFAEGVVRKRPSGQAPVADTSRTGRATGMPSPIEECGRSLARRLAGGCRRRVAVRTTGGSSLPGNRRIPAAADRSKASSGAHGARTVRRLLVPA